MSDFENFLCVSSVMARFGGTGSAEAKWASTLPVPPHRAIAEETQGKFSRLLISHDH